MSDIIIRSTGVKKATKKFKTEEAIAEYIWNGFDAGAKKVEIKYDLIPGNRRVVNLRIIDDGVGINHKDLELKFAPFLESEKGRFKYTNNGNPVIKGENGYGRFTFHKFSTRAEWRTRYKDKDGLYEYGIKILADTLAKFVSTEPKSVSGDAGTTVIFPSPKENLVQSFMLTKLVPFLKLEFAWYLELHKENKRSIIVNGKQLEYENHVLDRVGLLPSFQTLNPELDFEFNVRYVQWDTKLNDEYSVIYFIDSFGIPILNKTTKFNNKGDGFYHSIYVSSKTFDEFRDESEEDKPVYKQMVESVYKKGIVRLEEIINELLRDKRKPILRANAASLVAQCILRSH